jgi:hypothetical protein
MYPQLPETLIEIGNSMASFAKFEFFHYFQTSDFTHLHQMSGLIDYIRSLYQICDKNTRLMTLPQDGPPEHISMINYFTRLRLSDELCSRPLQGLLG